MKPTKRIEAEVLDVYQKWLHSYLNGDVKTYDSYFDNSFHFIGSTNNEEFLTRNDTTNFFKATAEQLAGKTQLRNETKIIEQFGELVFITHLFDAWFLNGNDWSFYGRFRFSNILEQNKDGWHFVYQHYSTPDSKAQDGETIGFNQITKENLELREAIQRRTVELEEKNKELEIEGSLERIRAKALAMTSSEDLLDVVVNLRTEFLKLGHEAHYFWHMMWLPDKYKKAMTSGDGTRIGMVMELPRHIHGKIPLLANWEKSTDPMVIYAMDAESAIDYVDKMITLGDFKQVDPQAPTHDDIRHIGGLTFIMARTTHGEIGYSLPGVVENPPKEDLEILVKFAGAFDLAHRRFLDLQKAEKQAREVQIELALEKVRSRTMAMQRSEELADVSSVLFQQVKELGIEQWTCGFNIWDTGDTEFKYFPGGPDGKMLPSCMVPLMEHPVFREFVASRKRGDDLMVYEKEGDIQKDHYKYMLSLPGIGDMLQGVLDQGMEFPDFQIDHIANFAYGNIVFITYQPVPEMHDVFKRFAKVFEQTYTRFLDLQKAETQAKEAQIEAALERVRAQSNAMHKSEDLANVVTTVYEELRLLNSKILRCGIGIINEKLKNVNTWITTDISSGTTIELSGNEPLSGHPLLDSIFDYWMKQKNLSYLLEGKDLIEYYKTVIKTDFQKHFAKEGLDNANIKQYYHCTMFAAGGLFVFESSPISKEQINVLQRFTDAFNRAYTRHQDLQKAETQAREAQIETALERVRAASLGMHKSEDHHKIVTVVFKQLEQLGVSAHSAFISENIEDRDVMHFWVAANGQVYPEQVHIPVIKNPIFSEFYKAFDNSIDFITDQLSKKEKNQFFIHYFKKSNHKDVPEERQKFILSAIGLARSTALFKNTALTVLRYEKLDFTKEENSIIKRIGAAFDQSYTRFLDLQKAEAQTREAQIEAALERVRARSMAMQRSEELPEVALVLWEQLKLLKLEGLDGCAIHVYDDKSGTFDAWTAFPDLIEGERKMKLNMFTSKQGCIWAYEEWDRHFRAGEIDFCAICNKPQLNEFIDWFAPHLPLLANEFRSFNLDTLYVNGIAFSNGILGAPSIKPLSVETWTAFKRLAAVFDLAYRRFADLQKAEAQAREAQIETALERVRSRSMAMHNSEELLEVITVVSEQLQELDFKFVHVSFANNDNSEEYKFWTAAKGLSKPMRFTTPYLDIAVFNNLRASQEKSDSFCTDVITKKEHNKWHSHLLKHGGSKVFSKEENDFIMSRGMARSTAINPNIMLILANYASIPYSEDENKIIERFGQVFEQSYTRFLDLQKAEKQTREAQIEAALEKVRSRSLAMHKPEELQEVVAVVAEKLKDLGVIFDAGGVILCTYFPDNKDVVHWIAVDDFSTSGRYFVPYFDNPIFSEAWDSKNRGDDYFSKEFSVKAKNDFFKQAFENSDYSHMPNDYKQFVLAANTHHLSAAWSKNSAIIIPSLTGAVPSESDAEIMKRFAKVFEQAYIRFMDLQKAEERARETQIDIALERVRSRTLEMQTSEELAETSMVVFQQLVALGIAPNRLFIGIIKDKGAIIEAWATNEDGKKIDSRFTLEASKNKSIKKMVTGWKQHKKSLVIDMKGKELQDYFQYLNKEMNIPFIHGLEQKRRVQTLAYFSEGLIGMAAPVEQSENSIRLLERFASVFNLTYTRFKDLKVAEAQAKKAEEDLINLQVAKKSAEKSLSELQQTQKQLIQSEKMASLGELTAGIAHEIQNPLNFVNNFSEVSKELLDEMLDEMENGDIEEVKAIMADVIQNLEKINHHGKRADAIVKGMLQHSRSSSGTKEPTDINALADEYLRLAYHGLRAKDKSFNATLETNFDKHIGKVNIMPQDMGRVILNLITNAFYASNERKQASKDEAFKPTVSVSTKKVNDIIKISVKDNGNGIPKEIVDKIFQPFFTTKPTGQGTGLGLSMSYDIVTKGHGGELKVETKEGEGSEFNILLHF